VSSAFDIFEPVLAPCETSLLFPEGIPNWRNGLLIRATNWLGDVMMTLPATYKMSTLVPDQCGVFVLSSAALAPVWRAAPWVSHVVEMSGKRLRGAPLAEARRLRAGVAVVLPNSLGSALDVYRCQVPIRLGRSGRGRAPLLTHRAPKWRRGKGTAQCHQLSHYLELARILGDVASDMTCPSLHIPDATDIGQTFGMETSDTQPWLALAPGAAYGPAKQWPPEHFAEVARWWCSEHGRCVVVGTEKERTEGETIAQQVNGVLNLAGKTGLKDLMAVLSVADAVVANDSGAMHLAAGLGTSGVAIFGSTDPVATGPLGAPWILLRKGRDCGPCFQRSCSHQDESSLCLTQVTSEEVCRALGQLLVTAK